MKSNTKITENKRVAIGYLRVSTEKQVEAISLDNQEELCRNAAKSDDLDIIFITDPARSGTSITKRKGMQEILELAKKREITMLYVAHSDRMDRSVVDHAFIRGVLRSNGVGLKYLNGQSSADDAASTMADNMFASINQYHSDNTREKTKQSTDRKAREGYLPTHAPIGYLNCENPNKNCDKFAKRIIIPNPKMAELVTEAFKLYATGQYSVESLNDLMFEKGLLTNVGKKIAPSVLTVLLKNRLYLGEIHWKDIHVKKGKHEPLIDEHTFNQVQTRMLEKVGGRCRRRKYFWLLNGFVFCPIHNRRFTAEFHCKKSISYYHCPIGKTCGGYINKADLEKQVSDKFKNLQFDSEFIDMIIKNIKEIFDTKKNKYFTEQRSFQSRKNACESKLRTVEDRLIDGTLSKMDYTRIKDEIRTVITSIDSQMSKLEATKEINIDIVSEILNLTKNIYNVYMQSPEQLQKKFLGLFFDKFEVENGLIIKTCYSPLFEELMRIKGVVYKTHKSEKTIVSNKESNFIINSKVGDYRELNPN